MSAVELRQAAETLRARADHAGDDTGKPWTAQVCDDGRAWINAPDEPHAIAMHGWPAAARYIATMHPGVGLALADWLDEVWAWMEEGVGLLPEGNIGDAWIGVRSHALTVARLINGGA